MGALALPEVHGPVEPYVDGLLRVALGADRASVILRGGLLERPDRFGAPPTLDDLVLKRLQGIVCVGVIKGTVNSYVKAAEEARIKEVRPFR